MQISLEEAIEIHARALTHRLGEKAPFDARQRAVDLKQAGDHEGHVIWLSVAEAAEQLLREGDPPIPQADGYCRSKARRGAMR